jgi:hypothetical protein
LLKNRRIDENLEAMWEFLRNEILRSTENLAKIILCNKIKTNEESGTVINPEWSSNICNRIDYVHMQSYKRYEIGRTVKHKSKIIKIHSSPQYQIKFKKEIKWHGNYLNQYI